MLFFKNDLNSNNLLLNIVVWARFDILVFELVDNLVWVHFGRLVWVLVDTPVWAPMKN